MPRYIDAERFKQWVQDNYVLYDGDRYLKDIDEQPTADVVEVVRCRNCAICEEHVQKHFDGSEDTWYICWRTRGYSLDGDGYCNHGVKKMTEEEYRCGFKSVTSAEKKNVE